jgi:hypothetical protein
VRVFKWSVRFREGYVDPENNPRSGQVISCPKSVPFSFLHDTAVFSPDLFLFPTGKTSSEEDDFQTSRVM